jgi:hypothetical protein
MRADALAGFLCVAVLGCGGGGPGDMGGDGGDDEAGDDGGGDDDGSGDDSGDDGGGGGGGGGFRVAGSVAAISSLRRGAQDLHVVDHVIAVAPSSQSQLRAYSEVGADGSFALDIDVTHPWVLVFVDSTRVGADMIAGVLGAGTLDTLTPTSNGAVDLGAVSIDESGEATAGLGYDELVAALGLDPAAAEYLGAIDDLCLRYVNPDIDGNGVMDVLEPEDHRFLLDFHVQRAMLEDGVPATIADVVGRFLDPATTTSSFGGTGVYVSVPSAFWDGPVDEASMTFSADLHYIVQLEGGGSTLETAPAGTAVGGDAFISNDGGDTRSVGVYAAPGFDLPQGSYQTDLGSTALTFTSVATLTDAELTSAEGTLLPFVRFVQADAQCASACAIAAIDVEWRKRTADGWILATAEELALTVGSGGGFASIVVGSEGSSRTIGITLPGDAPTSSVAWDPANAFLNGLDGAAFLSVTTDQLCHFGLSYDDRLGMRHFAGIGNAPGTCL